ncbi:MAG: aspartate kinase [Treponema sp.]|jgi:aspartate kinase|nr:aspartate kinase [Treponema sp.]
MIVMKFGGSSVADAARLRHIGGIVQAYSDKKPAVVLSAMGDTTDHLLEAADAALQNGKTEIERVEKLHLAAVKNLKLRGELHCKMPIHEEIKKLLDELSRLLSGIALIRELTPRTKDYLVSFGERLSVRIAAAYFRSIGINARGFDAWELGFVSNSDFGHAELIEKSWKMIPEKIMPLIKTGVLPVITGFIAQDERGNITTLGRGGSDLSATMIAAACKADEVQVWKDVDGILTADPRIVKNARPVQNVSYEEASELAYFGAQVLHPRAMLPCMKTGTPVLVKNSYTLEAPGTRIGSESFTTTKNCAYVCAITARPGVTLVDIVSTRMLGQFGFLAEIFSAFARKSISVDMVATSEVSVSLTLDTAYDLGELKKELSKIASVEIKKGKAIISIIGDVRRSSEILARTFKICQLIGVPVQMISQGASKVNISFIVDDIEAEEVIKSLHIEFFGKLERLS